MVAIELAARTLTTAKVTNAHVVIHSDNQGVVGALRAGFSRGVQQNHILREVVRIMQDHSLWLSVEYVSTHDNPADKPSRGVFPSRKLLYAYPPALPNHLRSYLHTSVSFHDTRVTT
jgi:hypothetical protein